MKKRNLIVLVTLVVSLLVVFSCGWAEEKTSKNDPKLKRWLQNRPEADLNNDGILTQTEVQEFRSGAQKEKQPEKIQQKKEEVHTMDTSDSETSSRFVYKTMTERELAVEVDYPENWSKDDQRPAIVFFQGGGFKNGGTNQFRPQAEYFAKRGIVTVRAEYRGMKTDGVLPDKCVEDAISAMRWVRKNASMLGIDPNRIISSGGSSGAHLALSVFCLEEFDTPGEDLSVSPHPNAMVLYNPAVDFLSEEKTMRAIGGDKVLGQKLSPLRHMNKILPPTLILYGTEDWLKSQEDEFVEKAKAMDSPIEVYLAEGAEHSFFNWSPWLEKTTLRVDEFLRAIGYLKDAPQIDPPTKERKKKSKDTTDTIEKSSPTGQSTSSENAPPTGTFKQGNLKWKFPTEGFVHSSPDISNGVVFFGSLDKNLYAVDIETGQEKWRFQTDGAVKSSPQIIDGTVYFGSGNGMFYALDEKSGKKKWEFKTRGQVKSSPSVADEAVYFGCTDGTFYAFNIVTKDELWHYKTEGVIKSSPTVVNGVVYFGSMDGNYYALDSKTGKEKWIFPTEGPNISSPLRVEKTVYFGSGDTHIYAVDAETGLKKWRFKTGEKIICSPEYSGGMIFCGSNDDCMYGLDAATGKKKWEFKTEGDTASSPAVVNGIVYFGSRDAHLYAVDIKTGKEQWRFKTERDITSSPIVLDGIIYFGSMDGNLYAIK